MQKPGHSRKERRPQTKVNKELKKKRKRLATQNLNKKEMDEIYNAVLVKFCCHK